MYIYFDRNGTIKEVINDESIRRGSSDYNKIYCYLEGNHNIDDIWYLQKNPDGTLTNQVSFVDNIVTKSIPYDSHRDMKYFQDFEEYQFYVFTLSSSYLSQNGLVVATIRVAENNTLWALGELTFNVQANIVNSDNDITQSQYDYLLLSYASRTLNEQTGSDLNALIEQKVEISVGAQVEQLEDAFEQFKEDTTEDIDNRLNAQDEQIRDLGQLQPSGVDTSTNILAKTSADGIWVGSDTGHWYYWNGTQYADGGVYQATEIPDYSIEPQKITGYEKANDIEYYSKVFNPTNYDYSNKKIEIKVNFKNGVCRNAKCIKLFGENGIEIDFSFVECFDENLARNIDYSYYSNGYIRTGYLVFIDSISANSSKNYKIKILPKEYEQEENITVSYTSGGSLRINTGNATFNMDNTSHFRMTAIILSGRTLFPDVHYGFILNDDTNIKEYDTAFSSYLVSESHNLEGDGVVELDFIRKLEFSNYTVIQKTKFYSNDTFECQTAVKFNNDVSGIKRHYVRMNCPFGVTGNKITNNSAESYIFDYTSYQIAVACLYVNANSQRDDQTLPIYQPLFSKVVSTSLNLVMGFLTTANTTEWKKNYILTNSFIFEIGNFDNNENYRIYNELNSFVCNKSIHNLFYDLKNESLKYLYSVSRYFSSLGNYFGPLSNQFYPYLELAKTMYYGNGFDSVVSKFNTMISGYDGTDKNGIRSTYNRIGLAILGRSLPIAYHLYKEYKSVEYKNILIAYGDMLVDLYDEKGDIPLTNTQVSGSGNSRALGLYGLAIANSLQNKEDYSRVLNAVNNLNMQDLVVGCIIPEGNVITNRYLHYTSMSNVYTSLACELFTFENNMTSLYNYLFSACLSTGEIKDLTLCSSDSRRGLPHTYSYIIGTLILSKDACALNQAYKSIEWLNNQTPFYEDSYPSMLDGYDTYPEEKKNALANVGLAIAGLIDAILFFEYSE